MAQGSSHRRFWPLLTWMFLSAAGSLSLENCPGSYNVSQGISLHRKSFEDGAELLATTLVNGSQACRAGCCSTPGCSLALLEQGGAPGGTGTTTTATATDTCFLVNCLSSQGPVCTFERRPGYETSSRSGPAQGGDPPTAVPADCSSPPKIGPCRARLQRWYYDDIKKTCHIFIYGGCLRNGNNFKSEKDCLKSCVGVTAPLINTVPASGRSREGLKDCSKPCSASEFKCADGCCVSRNLLCDGTTRCLDKSDDGYCKAVHDSYARLTEQQESGPQDNDQCNAPKKVGICKAAFLRWYFDTHTQTCEPFLYGGCQGNKNNYESEEDCLAACARQKEVVPEPQELQVKADDKDYCYAPAVTGHCRASFPRWYYNPQSHTCDRFTYGGCGGNKNNYESEAECLDRCLGKAGM
ncbi:actinia tenebrosa protease inhibitors-like [Cetorhinus maximus]